VLYLKIFLIYQSDCVTLGVTVSLMFTLQISCECHWMNVILPQ